MPIIKAAKKYMRVTKRKTAKNNRVKGVFRNATKKTREYATQGNVEESQKWLRIAVKSIDKAAQKKTIKKNTAARKKSRLNAMVKKIAKK